MTQISRRLSLPTHGAVESLCGMAIMLSPLVLPFGATGLVIVALLGAVVTGLGLGLISPRTDSVAAHRSLDALLVLVTALAALALAFAGEATAALVLAALVTVQATLSFTTSYATAT
jgi:Zn-dependent protease